MKSSQLLSAVLLSVPLSVSLSLTTKVQASELPCQAYLDASGQVDEEVNNCPVHDDNFSIIGTFSNPDWQVAFSQWEPGYYVLYIKNKSNGRTLNATGFNVRGTTSRPQYVFNDDDSHGIFVVSFRYSDPNTIRLQTFYKNHPVANVLLTRESDRVLGGP